MCFLRIETKVPQNIFKAGNKSNTRDGFGVTEIMSEIFSQK